MSSVDPLPAPAAPPLNRLVLPVVLVTAAVILLAVALLIHERQTRRRFERVASELGHRNGAAPYGWVVATPPAVPEPRQAPPGTPQASTAEPGGAAAS